MLRKRYTGLLLQVKSILSIKVIYTRALYMGAYFIGHVLNWKEFNFESNVPLYNTESCVSTSILKHLPCVKVTVFLIP